MRAVLIILLMLFFSEIRCYSQKGASIRNIDFLQYENTLVITYDIAGYKENDKFNIFPEIYKATGEKINAVSFSGDLKASEKVTDCKIVWDLGKDNITLDDEIYVVLKGEVINESVVKPLEPQKYGEEPVAMNKNKGKTVNRTACFFESLIFPGWGSSRITQKGWHFVKGFVGYGAAIGSFIFASKAEKSYNSYDGAISSSDRDYYYDLGQSQTRLSNILAGSAAVVWSIDLITVLVVQNKTVAQMSGPVKINLGYSLAMRNTPQMTCRITF